MSTYLQCCTAAYVNLLKTKHICFITGISPYCGVNTFHHGYKKTSQLMMYKAKVAVCHEISTKH